MLLHRKRQSRSKNERLVAEAGRDGDLVAALGAAAVQYSLAGFGGHTNEKSVDLGTATAIGLECALGHRCCPVCKKFLRGFSTDGLCGFSLEILCEHTAENGLLAARFEYISLEENRQRNNAGRTKTLPT
jgi:hypothetical protein